MSRYYRSFLEESGAVYTARTTALISATGLSDLTKINAINTFDLSILSLPFDADDYIYLGFLGSSTSNKYNFIDTTKYQLTFNGGWDFTNGMKPNGTNAYAQTGWNPLNRITGGYSYGSWGVYLRSALTSFIFPFGSYPGAASGYTGLAGNNATSQYWRLNGEANITPTTTNNKRFFQATRSANVTDMYVMQDAQQFTLSGIFGNGILSNREVYLGANNNIGTANNFSNIDMTCLYFSKNRFTQSEQTTMKNAVDTLMTTLGLNV
jgi:hypothetical protein